MLLFNLKKVYTFYTFKKSFAKVFCCLGFVLLLLISTISNSQVVINELGIAPTTGNGGNGGEFIELYNKGAASVNIGCYVIVFTGSGSAQGWTISIPANTILTCGQYYLIGGAGNAPSPITNWINTVVGGSPWINNYGTTNGVTTITSSTGLNIDAAKCTGKGSLPPGNLADSKGQLSLLTSAGVLVGSVMYNTGNYTSLYGAGSFSNPATGCSAISPIPNIPNSSVNINASFSGSTIQGIYLDDAGIYQTETDLTPGKSNSLNGGTQATLPAPTITLTSAASVCFSSSSQTTTLGYSATTNTPDTYSITWNATPPNSFAAVTNAVLPVTPINITVPANTTAGTYTGTITVKNACGQISAGTSFTVTVNTAPTLNPISNQSLCVNTQTAAIDFSGTGTAIYNWTNNTPFIGLAASGTGNISAFTALNPSGLPVTATITATPVSTGFAYVANYGTILSPGNTVSIINTATNTVTGTITVGSNPFGVAVSPDGNKVYVSNYFSNSVSVISTSTNTVIATIPVGSQPMGLVVSPDGTKLYVANQSLLVNPGSVSVISTASNTVTATIPVHLQPQGVAISPDGTRVYVANVNSNNVSVINTSTNIEIQLIGVGTQPICVAVSPDGSRLFVPNYGSNSVSIINLSTSSVIAIPVGTNPNGAAVSPDGTKVYITNQNSANVSVINTTTNAVSNTISVGTNPQGVSFTTDGSKAYVANFGSNNVSIVNTATNAVSTTVTVGSVPHSLGNFITASSACSGTPISFTITVNPTPVASISYTGSPFCAIGTANPTLTGTTGGIFSANNGGLTIDTNTGVINLTTSTAGVYTIKYNLTVNGCNTTPSTSVEVFALPTVPVASVTQQPTCSSPTGTILITSPLGASYSYSIDGTNFQTSSTFNSVASGTFTVTVKNTTTGCINVLSGITVNAAPGSPSAPIVTTPVTYCQNAIAAQLTATGSNLLWYTSASGGTGNSIAPTPLTTGGNISYYVSQTIGACESLRAVINIIVNALPTINAISNQTICGGTSTSPVTFTGTGTANYNWVNNAPSIGLSASGNGNISTFTAINSGSSVVTATITVTPTSSTNGCIGTPIIFRYIVNPSTPTPIAGVTQQPTCDFPAGTISITYPTGAGYTYSINGVNYTNTTGLFTGLSAGNYSATVKNSFGCVSSAIPLTINVAPLVPSVPVVSITQPTCGVSYGTLNITSPLGASYTYSIDGVYYQTSPLFNNVVPNTYTVIVKNIQGCTKSSIAIVNAAPVAPAAPTITTIQPNCTTTTGTITISAPIGLGLSYSIDGINYTNTTGVFTAAAAGTYSVTVQNAGGCISFATSVTLNTPPSQPVAPTVTSPVAYCQNAAANQLTAIGINLLWYTSSSGGTGSNTTPTPPTTVPGIFNYYVSQTVGGCESPRATIAVTVNQSPLAPTVTSPVVFCQNATVTSLTATGSNLLWYTAATGGTGNINAPIPSTTIVINTDYYVSQTVSGCESPRATITVNINAAPAAPLVTTPINYCQNSIATALTATGSNLLWYTNLTGGTGNINAPIPLTTTAGTTGYFVSQTTAGCESPRATILVNTNATPVAPFITASGNTTFCIGNSTILTSSAATGNQWYKDGILISGATNNTLTVNQSGNYSVVVTNVSGCTVTSGSSITITVFPNPIVSAGLDKTVFEGDSVIIQGSAIGGTTFTYSWLPTTYLSNSNVAAPWVVKPLTDMIYTLTATNENGCSNSNDITVTLIKDLIIPNAFSPNGDSKHDTWDITNLNLYKSCTVEVFDRNGQIVYKSFGYIEPWNGTYNGKQVPIGVYYYVINLGNGRSIKTGWVALFR